MNSIRNNELCSIWRHRAPVQTQVLRSTVGLLLVLASTQGFACAQWSSWHFEPHSYYDPLSAEPRSAETKILFVGRGSSVPYALNPGQSLIWDISVGTEIPIIGWTQGDLSTRNSPVAARRWGVGVWIPISFHLVEDLSKDPSAPVLNTDYRFGGMIKAQYGLADKSGMRESHIGLRYVPIAHESTHIGDEFILGATRKYGSTFERVNVSYQYWELGGSFETSVLDVVNTGTLRMMFRGGVVREAFHHGIGWYDTNLLQPDGATVTPSNRNIEPYFGVEAFYVPASWTSGPFVSFDDRNRTIYTYHRASPAVPENTLWSANIMAGWREEKNDRRFQPSYFVRYYHGVNPAGQFRSQPNYQLFGVGLLVHF